MIGDKGGSCDAEYFRLSPGCVSQYVPVWVQRTASVRQQRFTGSSDLPPPAISASKEDTANKKECQK